LSDNGDIRARFLIANGYARPEDYQRLSDYYENRGFYLPLSPPQNTYMLSEQQIRRLAYSPDDENKLSDPQNQGEETVESSHITSPSRQTRRMIDVEATPPSLVFIYPNDMITHREVR
jgi:hypothetical protein